MFCPFLPSQNWISKESHSINLFTLISCEFDCICSHSTVQLFIYSHSTTPSNSHSSCVDQCADVAWDAVAGWARECGGHPGDPPARWAARMESRPNHSFHTFHSTWLSAGGFRDQADEKGWLTCCKQSPSTWPVRRAGGWLSSWRQQTL
jgi:hypothetical protein